MADSVPVRLAFAHQTPAMYGPTTPANKDYNPGFTGAMMLKDLKLSQDAAQSLEVSSPLGAAATMLFSMYCNEGNDGDDFSGIIRMLRGSKAE